MIFARDRNGQPIEAMRDEHGVAPPGYCPCCGKQLQARIGEVRRPHWAHESGERCDEWWEEESDWRSEWMTALKDCPLLDLQNAREKDGVRHFYDVKDGESRAWVFRRKKLSAEHRALREQFFEKMLWVVEAKETEWVRFCSDRDMFKKHRIAKRTYRLDWQSSGFSSRWSECSMPVVFDFKSASEGEETTLWCVLRTHEEQAFALEFPREDFLARARDHGRVFQYDMPAILEKLAELDAQERQACRRKSVQTRAGQLPTRVLPGAKSPRRNPAAGFPVRPSQLDCGPVSADFPFLKEAPQEAGAPIEDLFEQKVAANERLGFSHADAVARASTE